MQYPSKFAALALAAAVAVTLTACAADPEPAHQSSRQASGIVALPAPTPPNETGVDAARYEAAMRAGQPFVYGIVADPEHRSTAICATGLVIPTGPAAGTWYLNEQGAPRGHGTAMSRHMESVGGCSGDTVPGQQLDASMLDAAAQESAAKAGTPFIYALPDGPNPACHSAIRLPDGTEWVMNASGPAPTAGMALSRTMNSFGCTSRGAGLGN